MENINLHLWKCQTSVSEKSPLKYLNDVFQLRWEKVIEVQRVPQMVQELWVSNITMVILIAYL